MMIMMHNQNLKIQFLGCYKFKQRRMFTFSTATLPKEHEVWLTQTTCHAFDLPEYKMD
jgi:hypothetical protein